MWQSISTTSGRSSGAWTGARGWIDNFVVFAHDLNPELACNQAKGTLVALGPEVEAGLLEGAGAYPQWAHAEIAASADSEAELFACVHDYARDYGAHLDALPAGSSSVREAINFPEGPIRAGAPRPDSTTNAFCLSCHSEQGRGGLGLDALSYEPDLLAEDDPRRQPSQPPRRVFGNIPGGWIPAGEGPGSPAQPSQAPPEGAVIDHWVLPAAP